LDYVSVARQLLISALTILIAITFHEVSHGYVAYRLGDPTAKFVGRLTLNPLVHIDPFGTVLLPFMLYVLTNGQFVFGYAKPVPINPMNFANPRKGMAISAAAGPITNLLLAFLSVVIMKAILLPLEALSPESFAETVLRPFVMIFNSSIVINVILASFNLIPIPPLDGGRVLVGFLPRAQAIAFARLEPFGFLIVIVLLATNMLDNVIGPVIGLFLHALL